VSKFGKVAVTLTPAEMRFLGPMQCSDCNLFSNDPKDSKFLHTSENFSGGGGGEVSKTYLYRKYTGLPDCF
jgi:hypothetical protein